jgi:biotin operon repressor
MVFNLFFRNSHKNEIETVKEEIKNSFSNVKTDMDKISQWVTHLHGQDLNRETEVSSLKGDLSTMKNEISELKDLVSSLSGELSERVFTTPINSKHKQTSVVGVQTPVQTPVQTTNFYGISNLSVTERAIVWLLANSELKLSYDDLAAMLGKTKSTVRGQINSVRQKSEGLILEVVEKNGMKRVYMPQEVKEKMLKKAKVSVKRNKKSSK